MHSEPIVMGSGSGSGSGSGNKAAHRAGSHARVAICADDDETKIKTKTKIKIKTKTDEPVLLPVVVLDPGDWAKMTPGICEAIHFSATASGDRVCRWTCLSQTDGAAMTAATATIFATLPQHIQQPDRWIPLRLPPTPTELPTVLELQGSLEHLWNEDGMDPDGAAHYGRSLRGKTGQKANIGAVEVAHLCLYYGIDAAVVQFIRCTASRRLLPSVVWSYFAENGPDGVDSAGSRVWKDAPSLARILLERAEARAPKNPDTISPILPATCYSYHDNPNLRLSSPSLTLSSVARLPLYLQWEGHSVTIVGIWVEPEPSQQQQQQRSSSSFENSGHDSRVYLLVLDPMKAAHPISQSIPLPWDSIRQKDLQIVLCTDRSLEYSDRQYRDSVEWILTAAQER
eukprot:jgi/Psemu1/290016/fgenesh1_pg.437_\